MPISTPTNQRSTIGFKFDQALTGQNLPALRDILNNIQRYPRFYEENRDRLQAADLAYFAHNASLDDGPVGDDDFHDDFLKFREGTRDHEIRRLLKLRLLRATFDHAAKLDHISGGSTLVIHIPGALEPLTPALPEHILAHVYVPGTVRREFQREMRDDPIPEIVQLAIREIGVPTVERFDRSRCRLWPFPRNTNVPRPRPLPTRYGMPEAIPEGSSRYTLYGRRCHPSPDPVTYFAPVGVWRMHRIHDGIGGGDLSEPMEGTTTLDDID